MKTTEDKSVQTKKTSHKAIEDYRKKYGFNLSEVVNEQDNNVIVAFGYKNRKYSELKHYDKKSKAFKTLFIDGENSFSEFVVSAKQKYQQQ